jgi:SAM-dependent methyltransferase
MDHKAFWTARYESVRDDFLFGREPSEFLVARKSIFQPNQSAIMIADGEGRNSVWLASQGLTVTSNDICEVAIRRARKLAAESKTDVNFIKCNILTEEWPTKYSQDSFDWVVGIFIQFADKKEQRKLFSIMRSMTKPNGRLLLLGYTPKQLEYKTGGPSTIESLYTKDLLQNTFQDWNIEELVEYEKYISEGSGHNGISALIGMIARKPSDS